VRLPLSCASPRRGRLLAATETGMLWSPVTAEALAGPLTGSQLELVPSFTVFWFA
jgi:hypothetical protein